MVELDFALCGFSGPYDEYNPYYVTQHPERQRIIIALHEEPQTISELAAKLNMDEHIVRQHVDALLRCGLARIGNDGKVRLTFTVLLGQDLKKLEPVMNSLTKDLVEIARENINNLKNIVKNIKCTQQGNFPELNYIILVAYTFDFEGLNVLSSEGYLVVTREMPGNRRYVFSAVDKSIINLKSLFKWGHSYSTRNYEFFTHGNVSEYSPRLAFPDLATYVLLTQSDLGNYIDTILEASGKLLENLASCELKLNDAISELEKYLRKEEAILLLQFLASMGYVIYYPGKILRLGRPFLYKEDVELILSFARNFIKKFIECSLSKRWSALKEVYMTTGPARHGVPIEEAFNIIYHIVFSRAALFLLEEGFLYLEYDRNGARYCAWVSVK